MLTRIVMPQLGESVTEGTVDRWLKHEGDHVARDEALVEVITDKVNAEIPSPVTGVLVKISAQTGETVLVDAELAVMETADVAPQLPTSTASPDHTAAPADDVRAGREGLAEMSDEEAVRRRSTPLVRRLAEQHGVNLAQVPGSGFGGRVRKEDLTAYRERERGVVAGSVDDESAEAPVPVVAPLNEPPSAPSVPVAVGGTSALQSGKLLPVSPVRRAIARHVTDSLRTAPQVTTVFEIDMTAIVRLRTRYRDDYQRQNGVDLTYLACFLKAVADALGKHPLLNATWTDDGIHLFDHIHLGIAVAVPAPESRIGHESLLVPVIHHAERLNLRGLSHAARDLVTRARAGQLRPEDVRGGTCTVNNTGTLGSLISTPIIQQPQSAIVTLESIVKRPVVVTGPDGEDSLVIRSMAYSCLTFDHRVMDGMAACAFLQSVKTALETADASYLD